MDKLHILERAADDKAARPDSPADPARAAPTGPSVVHPVMPQWTGNAPGASTSSAPHMSGVQIDPGGDGILGGGGLGGVGGGGLGGAGGGGHAGVGGGRSGAPNQDMAGRAPMPKMSFPRFDGVHPRVWRDKCHDYFRAFNISPTLWVTTATLHMDGNAAIWLQAFRQRHALGPWPTFIAAVESEFGADDQRQSMKALLSLKQQGTVDEYYREFQALMYLVTMHDPNYDEHFFVTQFIKGLDTSPTYL
jgi:hypothetical protein